MPLSGLLLAVPLAWSHGVRSLPLPPLRLPGLTLSTPKSSGPGASSSQQPQVPALPQPPLVRLIVEPAPSERGLGWIDKDDRAGIEAVLEAHGPRVRAIRSDGPSAIFEGRAFVEVEAAFAGAVAADFEAMGLRVSSLEEAVSDAGSWTAAAIGGDDELKAAAARLMDGSPSAQETARRFGALLAAVEAAPAADLSARSEEARRDAARAIYNGLVPVLSAHNAIRGEQRIAARQRWLDAHGGQAGSYLDMELYAHAELQKPENSRGVAPIRALAMRAAAALQSVGSDLAAPLLLAMLPHAGHGPYEALAKDPARAAALAGAWLSMLERTVEDTATLVEEHVTTPDETRRDRIRMPMRSGGISGLDDAKVVGHRAALWAYDLDAWVFDFGELREQIWPLLGASDAAARALIPGFVDVLVRAGPAIKRVSDALRAQEEEKARRGFDRMAGKFLERPELKAQLDEARAEHIKDQMERYDEYSRIEGHYVLDRALQALSWFGPYDHLAPGFDVERYATYVSQILRDAAARVDPWAFKMAAQTSLRFAENIRKWAWPKLYGPARDEVEALEREVKARAAAEGLQLVPEGGFRPWGGI
jgi:hypothetical protein